MTNLTQEQADELQSLESKAKAALGKCGAPVLKSRHKRTLSAPEQAYQAAIQEYHTFGFNLGIFGKRKQDGSFFSYSYT